MDMVNAEGITAGVLSDGIKMGGVQTDYALQVQSQDGEPEIVRWVRVDHAAKTVTLGFEEDGPEPIQD